MQQVMTESGQVPPVLAGRWDLRLGYHPSLKRHLPMLADLPLFDTTAAHHLHLLELPLAPALSGHHMVADSGLMAAAMPPGGMAEAVDEYPLAPVFVRDLCGRPVHTGLMPLPAPPTVPLFPPGCRHLPASHPLSSQLERLVWMTARRLECAPVCGSAALAGEPDTRLRAMVAQPQTYPYKLRPDTFYADGWRLPVVPRVYAVPAPPVQAQAAADELLARWQARPTGQDYETFYDANNGDAWFEELFEKGCTVIPTLEAYNGRYHVGDDYVATAVDPGRAVAGLHEIIEHSDSDTPAGTILDVRTPGWVTSTGVHPAQVVVSNGSGWQAPSVPLPPLPNRRLPHPRVGGAWGAVWLPTHPGHFAEPALYDWNMTGHFVQVSGPLWDPLHYIYTSTEALTRAFRRPHPQVPGAYVLPPSLKLRFHPLAPQTWYDTLNERTAQQRQTDPAHPLYGSTIDTLPLGRQVAPAGYHPLPWALEYELDPAHFPSLHPAHLEAPCPPDLEPRLMPPAQLADPAAYLGYHVAVTEPMREAQQQAAAAPFSEASCDIKETLLPLTLHTQPERALPAYVPDMPASQLAVNIKRLFAARAYRQQLQALAEAWNQPGLPAAFYQFRESALAWRRLRYRLFTKYAATWQQAAAVGIDLPTAEQLVPESDPLQHQRVQRARLGGLGVVPPLPLLRADGLPSPAAQAKLAPARRRSQGKGLPASPAKPRQTVNNPGENT